MQVLNEQNFEEKINKKGAVLVDFFATWCGPCKMLAPILEQTSQELPIDIYKVDIDESEMLSRKYGIMVVPTMIIFVDGKMIEKFSGFLPKDALVEKLKPYVDL